MKALKAFTCVLSILIVLSGCKTPEKTGLGIADNPFYWTCNGDPIVLLGGTDDDNLFQWPDPIPHLDLLRACGGNYIRNTMSSRDTSNVQAFMRNNDGTYDLGQWNDDYWQRLETLLSAASERDIVVEIEIWATYDFYLRSWTGNPFNPDNNINYTAKESALPVSTDYNNFNKVQPFFKTVPNLEDNPTVRKYQEKYVDKLLSISLKYDNVLYCINNETCADSSWGIYWAKYVRAAADSLGKRVYLTDMFDNWDPSNGAVQGAVVQDRSDHPYIDTATATNTLEHPEIYDFIDISNHNVQNGQVHYHTARYMVDRVRESGIFRPVTCIKVYGGTRETDFDGTYAEGQRRFWRNVFAGVSSSRFHRPPYGLGLDSTAQVHIRSLRQFTDSLGVFSCVPDNSMLTGREKNEAYCLADRGIKYGLYFPHGGDITLQVPDSIRQVQTVWLNILKSEWSSPLVYPVEHELSLVTPDTSQWAVYIKCL